MRGDVDARDESGSPGLVLMPDAQKRLPTTLGPVVRAVPFSLRPQCTVCDQRGAIRIAPSNLTVSPLM
jgi:hypothetical protein